MTQPDFKINYMGTNTLSDLFAACFGALPDSVAPLPVSGSHRQYFRLLGCGTGAIGVIGTDRRENSAFCAMAGHFRSKGINVPEIYGISGDGMCYLQEDLGDVSLFDYVSRGRKEGSYSPHSGAFDGRMVMFDLNYFKYCFLKTAGIDFDEIRLQQDFESLRDDIAAVPSDVFMSRDFQSRNVMVKDGKPYYIDFQGGMKGPMYYDLASFIWQARARYPQGLRRDMIKAYLDALSVYRRPDPVDFHEKLRLFVLVRTLQVLGAYGFRGYFEKKEHFLKSIPAAVENIRGLLSAPLDSYPYLGRVLGGIVAAFDRGELKYLPEEEPSAGEKCLTVTVCSFSYKKGIPEDISGNGGGYVFDCRSIHNPGRYPQYRSLTGKDAAVAKFLEDDGEVFRFLDNVYSLVDTHVARYLERGFTHLMVCFGCTGGQHRSVYCAEKLAGHLSATPGVKVRLFHREEKR